MTKNHSFSILDMQRSLLEQAKDKENLANNDPDSIFLEDAQILREAAELIATSVPYDFYASCVGLEVGRRLDAEKKIPYWHSIKELPREDGWYLVAIKMRVEEVNHFIVKEMAFFDSNGGWVCLSSPKTKPLCWMEVPKIPTNFTEGVSYEEL